MGIDRDWNGVLNGVAAPPSLEVASSGMGVRISWPANAAGVFSECSESLSPLNWRTESSIQELNSDRLIATVLGADEKRSYRLRGL